MRAILIGGTSHVGKSTLAQKLSQRLSWQHLSTDSLARHPGRPWKDEGEVPEHIRKHYLAYSTEELVDEVTQHYVANVWPIASAIVRTRISNPYDSCIVLEGSAVLPDLVLGAKFELTSAVWLTASNEMIAQRIHSNSRYAERGPKSREMIDRFLSRSLAFNVRLLHGVRRNEQRCIDISGQEATDRLLDELTVLGGTSAGTVLG